MKFLEMCIGINIICAALSVIEMIASGFSEASVVVLCINLLALAINLSVSREKDE